MVAMCGWGLYNGKCIGWGGNGPIWSIFFNPTHPHMMMMMMMMMILLLGLLLVLNVFNTDTIIIDHCRGGNVGSSSRV